MAMFVCRERQSLQQICLELRHANSHFTLGYPELPVRLKSADAADDAVPAPDDCAVRDHVHPLFKPRRGNWRKSYHTHLPQSRKPCGRILEATMADFG